MFLQATGFLKLLTHRCSQRNTETGLKRFSAHNEYVMCGVVNRHQSLLFLQTDGIYFTMYQTEKIFSFHIAAY